MKTFNDYVTEAEKMKGEDPCWKDYEMIGQKMKNGRKVPNCVPKNEEVELEEDIKKEYDAMKKHDIGTLRNMIKNQRRVSDTSEYRSKDHAISAYLRHKHGDKKVAAAMGLKESGEQYKIKSTGYHPEKGDFYISPKSGKPVYKSGVKKGDHENPKTGEIINQLGKSNKSMHEETKDAGEYDFEGQMARTQLQTIMRNSKDLIDMLSDDDNLPEWVQSKITLAQDYVSAVRDYLQSIEELNN
jgi:hypothetical protein